MRSHKLVTTMGLWLVACSVAQAGSYTRQSDYDYADVIDVRPIYKLVQKPMRERQCWDEEVAHRVRHDDSGTAMILGGIVGGVLGNQFGGGHGRQAATVAGTLLGGAVGRDVGGRDARAYTSMEERCDIRTEYVEEEHLSGYKVTYRYGDRVYTRTMGRDPGSRLRVNVSVTPVE